MQKPQQQQHKKKTWMKTIKRAYKQLCITITSRLKVKRERLTTRNPSEQK